MGQPTEPTIPKEGTEYLGESISEDGVRIIHRRVVRVGDGVCARCMLIRRLLYRLSIILGGGVIIYCLSLWFGWE